MAASVIASQGLRDPPRLSPDAGEPAAKPLRTVRHYRATVRHERAADESRKPNFFQRWHPNPTRTPFPPGPFSPSIVVACRQRNTHEFVYPGDCHAALLHHGAARPRRSQRRLSRPTNAPPIPRASRKCASTRMSRGAPPRPPTSRTWPSGAASRFSMPPASRTSATRSSVIFLRPGSGTT